MSTPTQTARPNPFAHNPKSRNRRAERWAFMGFRIATYMVLAAAIGIFAKIIYEGSKTVFTTDFPFVNVEFLTDRPQTLYVFEYEGEKFQLSDARYREFLAERGLSITDIPSETYAYSGGGILPAIIGTFLLVVGSMFIALTLGILAAIFLSEYAGDNRFVRTIRLAILNLAGVPSIVFGLFGFGMFVLFFDWGQSLIAGWFTLAFMVLPIVITSSEEALRAVPKGFREGSLALGATKWQAIRTNVLPYATGGILTSSVLGIARVAGETAPIMFTAAFASRDQMPWDVQGVSDFVFQGVMALPYHIYVVSAKIPQNEYTERMQYGTAFVFLILISLISATAVLLRARARKKYRW